MDPELSLVYTPFQTSDVSNQPSLREYILTQKIKI